MRGGGARSTVPVPRRLLASRELAGEPVDTTRASESHLEWSVCLESAAWLKNSVWRTNGHTRSRVADVDRVKLL
jgi:hypothetical protein